MNAYYSELHEYEMASLSFLEAISYIVMPGTIREQCHGKYQYDWSGVMRKNDAC